MTEKQGDTRYTLAPGTQVREEDFGLLFYTMAGPRLYFLYCDSVLTRGFFQGRMTVKQWLERKSPAALPLKSDVRRLEGNLNRLAQRGVIIES